jgi:hypothetical protein
MDVLCRLGVHAAALRHVSNHGYDFSSCQRCGRTLVRAGARRWATPPRGYRVVWRPRSWHPAEAEGRPSLEPSRTGLGIGSVDHDLGGIRRWLLSSRAALRRSGKQDDRQPCASPALHLDAERPATEDDAFEFACMRPDEEQRSEAEHGRVEALQERPNPYAMLRRR